MRPYFLNQSFLALRCFQPVIDQLVEPLEQLSLGMVYVIVLQVALLLDAYGAELGIRDHCIEVLVESEFALKNNNSGRNELVLPEEHFAAEVGMPTRLFSQPMQPYRR